MENTSMTAGALPHLAVLARLPHLPERDAELVPRINIILGMARLLDDLDLRDERPHSVFDPSWTSHGSE